MSDNKLLKFSNWLTIQESMDGDIDQILTKNGIIMFFKSDGKIYGTNDENRMIYAEMVEQHKKGTKKTDPHKIQPDDFFEAYDLVSLLKNTSENDASSIMKAFFMKSIPEIEKTIILDKKNVVNELTKMMKKKDIDVVNKNDNAKPEEILHDEV